MPPRPKYQSVIDFLEEIRRSVSGVPAGAEFYLSVARGLTPGAREQVRAIDERRQRR
jgi:hypothetical protein